MEPVTRRQSTSHIAQWFWDAIASLRPQKQVASLEKIGKTLHKLHDMNEEDVKKHLDMLLADGLLVCEKKVGKVEYDCYRAPTVEDMDKTMDDHDWYCFECHQSGPVYSCQSCQRVYHGNCLPTSYKNAEGTVVILDRFECPKCQEKDAKDCPPFRRRALNRLLNYVHYRLAFRLPYPVIQRDLTIPPIDPSKKEKIKVEVGSPNSTPLPPDDDSWRVKFLLKTPLELYEIKRKTVLRRYATITEFLHDVQMVMHNAAVYHGVNSIFADAARAMIRDCIYDLNEIRQCRYCYRVSNEMATNNWFCEPCYPKHELVFARQKGYPFWPAKVIKKTGNMYDVRFFGGDHERAMIDYSNIKPIDSSPQKLQVKKSALWTKAFDELKRHQEMILQAPSEPVESEGDDDPLPSDAEEEEMKVSLKYVPDKGAGAKTPSKKLKTPKKEKPASPSPVTSAKKVPPKKIKRELPDEYTVEPQLEEEPKPAKKKKMTPVNDSRAGSEDLVTSTSQEIAKSRRDSSSEKPSSEVKEEIARIKAKYDREIRDLIERHKAEIAEIKKKQWCYNCDSEAIYHCCWNTAYCSIECQQVHWQREHKRYCRRKRPPGNSADAAPSGDNA